MCETNIDPRYLRALELLRNRRNNEDVIIGNVSEFSEKELSKMEESQENSKRYLSLVVYSVPYVDTFESRRVIDKRDDSVIMNKNNKSFPLIIEVSYGSESFNTLIIELLNYLTEFTDTIYAIGFFIDRESDNLKAR
ncbi:unnamed protein product [Brachionus calyciflorus]|uniref:Uncharacterized protein n=1 Tax=Brachionus calyciflorus TaxID=104777 RepID=A0A814HLT4_9BILA|nr:unnamed protein product [Brachionus calyciflorus]